MRVHNIYTDENGETHFRDIDVEMTQQGPDGTTSKRLPATGIYFRTTPADWFFDWHPATRRQYVINLDAPNKITASDGETRIIGVGEIILIEDTHGKGHMSQAVGQMRRSIMIPIDWTKKREPWSNGALPDGAVDSLLLQCTPRTQPGSAYASALQLSGACSRVRKRKLWVASSFSV
jgi:hypothetical protein